MIKTALDALADAIEDIASVRVADSRQDDGSQLDRASRQLAEGLARLLPIRGSEIAHPTSAGWYTPQTQIDPMSWRFEELDALADSAGMVAVTVGERDWVEQGRALRSFMNNLESALFHSTPVSEAAIKARFELLDDLSSIRTRLSAVLSAIDDLDSINAVRKDAEKAAGKVADQEIAAFFELYGKQRRKAYRIWSAIMGACLTTSVGVSYFTLRTASGQSLQDDLARWALLVPLLAFAGYATRQSSRNRSIAEWSEVAHLRARSIDAFVQRLPDSNAIELLHKFGLLIYASEWTFKSTSSDVDATESLLSRVLVGRR